MTLHKILNGDRACILRVAKEGADNERIRSLWTTIMSANLLSDVIIKKVKTQENFRSMLSRKKEWKKEYSDYWYTWISLKDSLGKVLIIRTAVFETHLFTKYEEK